jgi:enoyl-CoA hydratase/carnithine racemase
MPEEIVLVKRKDEMCTVVMNRPHVMNALNMEALQELQKTFDEIASDESVRVVILEGAGENFSSGADMALFVENLTAPQWLGGMKLFGRLIRTMREMGQPVISKVRGVAVGGGVNLALAGDFVLASHDARLCEIFVHIGAILDGGGTYFLPRLVGLAKAKELALLGDFVDGKTAAHMGLIYKSVPDGDLDREAESLAKRLTERPSSAMALIKEGLEGSFDMSLNEVLEWEAAHQSIMLQGAEHKGAVEAFLKSRGKG